MIGENKMEEKEINETEILGKKQGEIKNTQQGKDKEKSFQGSRCEVFSRVVGYIRPVSQWNEGKAAEFQDRKNFEVA